MRRGKLENMAESAGYSLKKCTPADYHIGKWKISGAGMSKPEYFEVLKDVENWLNEKGVKFIDGRRGRSTGKCIWFNSKALDAVNKYARADGSNFSEAVRNLVGLGLEAWECSTGWNMPSLKMLTRKEAIEILLNNHSVDLGKNPGRYFSMLQEKGLLPEPAGVRKFSNTYHHHEIIPRILEIKERQRGGATLKQIKKHFDDEYQASGSRIPK
jgi:hypothetical protein